VERSTALGEVFRKYLRSKRTFLDVAERCSLKGWPDLKPQIVNAWELQRLFNEQETLRLEYWLSVGDPKKGSWTSVSSISRRLLRDWDHIEERTLADSNVRYREIAAEIARRQAALDSDAIREPFDAARRDPEYAAALLSMQGTLRDLDAQLATGNGER